MIYLDMDGVLAKYDYSMYSKKNPAWNDYGAHAFRTVKCDWYANAIVDELLKIFGDDIYVLTSISNVSREVRNEQIRDKMDWLAEFYPTLNLCNFIACDTDKRNSIQKIKGFKLSKSDILIDDYNKNLFAWSNAGGTAIKYLNGINSVGPWPGCVIECVNEDEPKQVQVSRVVQEIARVWYEHGNK